VIDLNATYRRLARAWTHQQLAERYQAATRHPERGHADPQDAVLSRPIAILAAAIPSSASLSVAIHVLHVLPANARGELAEQLVDTAEENAANVIHLCHRSLDLDGQDHDYTAEEWLPVVYDIAAQLLESARLDQEPPSVVQHTQEAVHWLSSAIVDLDQDSREAPAAIADTVGRLLVVCAFAHAARHCAAPADE
jgi:hypothetical protein